MSPPSPQVRYVRSAYSNYPSPYSPNTPSISALPFKASKVLLRVVWGCSNCSGVRLYVYWMLGECNSAHSESLTLHNLLFCLRYVGWHLQLSNVNPSHVCTAPAAKFHTVQRELWAQFCLWKGTQITKRKVYRLSVALYCTTNIVSHLPQEIF